jgi:hypothetical protein
MAHFGPQRAAARGPIKTNIVFKRWLRRGDIFRRSYDSTSKTWVLSFASAVMCAMICTSSHTFSFCDMTLASASCTFD